MPCQYCDHEHQGSARDFQGHPVEGQPSVERFGAERGNVWQAPFTRDSFSDFSEGGKCGRRRWPEVFHCSDHSRVVQFIRVAVCRFPIQGTNKVLLSWAQNVLGKAAEIAEHPQKIDPVPAGGGDVFHPLIGLECDENSLWEQGKLRGDVNASCLSAVRLPDTARVTGYHERCCG